MKIVLGALGAVAAMVLTFAVVGVAVYFVSEYWMANVMHRHDGQAGVDEVLIGFWVGLACSIVVGFLAVRIAWRKYLASGQ